MFKMASDTFVRLKQSHAVFRHFKLCRSISEKLFILSHTQQLFKKTNNKNCTLVGHRLTMYKRNFPTASSQQEAHHQVGLGKTRAA